MLSKEQNERLTQVGPGTAGGNLLRRYWQALCPAGEITEQVPDQVIAWRSVSGAANAGTVRFEPVSQDRTRVRLIMEYEPEGAVEKTGDAVGIFSKRVQNTVEDFKKYVEKRGAETGAWRGDVPRPDTA